MTQPFVDLDDAANALAAVIEDTLGGSSGEAIDRVVALGTGAIPIAQIVSSHLHRPFDVLDLIRGDSPQLGHPPACADQCLLVVDRGVETGQSALLSAQALREAGASTLILGVPVCPRQAEVQLAHAFDVIVAVQRPLARRSLQWHYLAPLE